MLTVGYILSGLATSAVGFVDTATMMAALSAVAGFAAACVNPLLVIFISELYPASMRASVVGLWCTSQQMGGIVANNFASSLLGAGQSWRNVFAYSGFIVAAFALPLSFGSTLTIFPRQSACFASPHTTSITTTSSTS